MLKSVPTVSSVSFLSALSPLCPCKGSKVGLPLGSKCWFCQISDSQKAFPSESLAALGCPRLCCLVFLSLHKCLFPFLLRGSHLLELARQWREAARVSSKMYILPLHPKATLGCSEFCWQLCMSQSKARLVFP